MGLVADLVATEFVRQAAAAVAAALRREGLTAAELEARLGRREALAEQLVGKHASDGLIRRLRPYRGVADLVRARLGPELYDQVIERLAWEMPAHAAALRRHRAWAYTELEAAFRALLTRLD